MVQWSISSLAELFRGTREPPVDMEHYPEAYVDDFSQIESSVLMAHDFIHDVTDDEFVRIYSLIKRRPEARSEGFLHDIVYQAAALMLGLRPRSQKEFEAVFSQLARSARHWRVGYVSRNYVAYLKKSFSDLPVRKNDGRERLLKRLRDRNSPIKDAVVVQAPPQMEKMSEVIMDFAEPLLKDLERTSGIEMDDQLQKNIIIFAIFAWNAALLPAPEREKMKKSIITGLPRPLNAKDFELAASYWFDELIKRKKEFFSDNRRYIVDFEFSGSGDTLYLNVMSCWQHNG
ncbi:MAG: hypothetical protein NC930_04435 [Candidatus Omnitrophica bacterium]|nr:hypothetical protein [Candidatus Omnitrophota bacterium]